MDVIRESRQPIYIIEGIIKLRKRMANKMKQMVFFVIAVLFLSAQLAQALPFRFNYQG